MIDNISLIIDLIGSPLSADNSLGRPSQKLIDQLLLLLTTTNSNVPIFISGESSDDIPIVLQYGDLGNNLLTGGEGRNILFGNQGIDIIYGDRGNDTLYGGRDNDFISGDYGNDFISGDRGNDIMTGGSLGESNPGFGQIDTLSGGNGIDNFVLSTTVNTFYQDGDTTVPGLSDYALITDFNINEDYLWLRAGPKYLIGPSPVGLTSGIALFIDDDGLLGLTANDELIAVLQGAKPESQVLSRLVLI